MVNQYDVYWVDLNPTIGAEMQTRLPICKIFCIKCSANSPYKYTNRGAVGQVSAHIATVEGVDAGGGYVFMSETGTSYLCIRL